MNAYANFLESKVPGAPARGLVEMPAINGALFSYQRDCVEFLLGVGGGGLFLDTGLGKTLCELEWCSHAAEATNGRALILTPLAVAHQIEREGRRFGYAARVVRDESDVREGINICNYDRLDKLDPAAFGAVALDESSILKSFGGKTTRALIASFRGHRFKLSATATPAPNDHMELGNHAEFCGVMASNEMLSRFFINDTSTASQQWRLKRHGVVPFWDWMASWSRCAQMPSDLGYSDDGFNLPPLEVHSHTAHQAAPVMTGGLFDSDMVSATNMHNVKRQTATARAVAAAELALGLVSEPWVIWTDTDYEADAVMAAIGDAPGVVEVRGSMSAELKESSLDNFADGTARVLVTKPSICGFGLNWQHCANTVFVGRSFSYEAWYQAVRRFWRFGQKREVNVHLIVAPGEDSIARVIDRKADDHMNMKSAMREAMRRDNHQASQVKVRYEANNIGRLPSWL
jgi:superfamily II DNA or RNA helicase